MTDAIVNATLEPRIVTTSTQLRACAAQPGVSGAKRAAAVSHGGRSAAIIAPSCVGATVHEARRGHADVAQTSQSLRSLKSCASLRDAGTPYSASQHTPLPFRSW